MHSTKNHTLSVLSGKLMSPGTTKGEIQEAEYYTYFDLFPISATPSQPILHTNHPNTGWSE
jgi:hypothetical protein